MHQSVFALFLVICLFVPISKAYGQPQSQQPLPLPSTDLSVEVVADLPLPDQVTTITRLLGVRQSESNGQNNYPPTILELIKLVEPHPLKPKWGSWKSISVLVIRFDQDANMTVEYCVEKCRPDQIVHSRRKMMSYQASKNQVATRLNARIAELGQAVKPD